MRNLLHATDRDRLAAWFRGPIERSVALDGRRLTALAEGEAGGSFCAAAGNARAAEALAMPDIHDAAPGLAAAAIDFAMAMEDAPEPCGRLGCHGLLVVQEDPRDLLVLTPFDAFGGDLSIGMLHQRPRGPLDALVSATHGGNNVEFQLGWRPHREDVEEAVTACGLDREGETVVAWHESRVMGRAGWLRPRRVEVGRVRYAYTISGASPLLRLTVTFTAAVPLRRVRLTTALDGLSDSGFAEGVVQEGAGWRRLPPPSRAGTETWQAAGPASHVAVAPEGWPPDGATLHLRPVDPDRVLHVRATALRPGQVQWVLLRHGGVSLAAGETLVVREDRFLSRGLTAPEAAQAMAMTGADGLDLQPLPPQGATLNAIGTHLLFAAAEAYRDPVPAARRAALAAWFDAHLDRLMDGEAGLEDLAHAALGVDARLRAEAQPRHATALGDLAGRILALQGDDGVFRDRDGRLADPAVQAMALLALARALPQLDPARIAPAIAAALAAVRPGMVDLVAGPRRAQAEGLLVGGAARQSELRYGEGVALMVRATGAVMLAATVAPGALDAAAIGQAEELHHHAIALLRPLVRLQGGTLVVMPSPLGGDTEPTTQAAAMLGLMAPDAVILGLAAAPAA
ncbi:hypothetical protein G3576_16680 [Roseomonas stagni]|uniref:Uncharacterized protein n=1 Tax=Falsiroseomonas algicola TaxID=2716930 RepID=A0A6M1LMS1_9PROT|nr:hypothetical protein [Falsiroseomonas algicola]NGM21661.1 hypothetical protein [Falsiroseomonas algicola]